MTVVGSTVLCDRIEFSIRKICFMDLYRGCLDVGVLYRINGISRCVEITLVCFFKIEFNWEFVNFECLIEFCEIFIVLIFLIELLNVHLFLKCV